jgi:hypothetical protein
MLNQLQSPTKLADTPAPLAAVMPGASGDAAPPGAVRTPAAEQPGATSGSQAQPLAAAATLLDAYLDYLASQDAAASGSSGADNQLPGSPGAVALADDRQ